MEWTHKAHQKSNSSSHIGLPKEQTMRALSNIFQMCYVTETHKLRVSTSIGWGSLRWALRSIKSCGIQVGTSYGLDKMQALSPSTPAWRLTKSAITEHSFTFPLSKALLRDRGKLRVFFCCFKETKRYHQHCNRTKISAGNQIILQVICSIPQKSMDLHIALLSYIFNC